MIQKTDLKTNHEEADTTVTAQAIFAAQEKRRKSLLKQMTQISMFCCCTIRDRSKIRGGEGWCKHGEGHGFSCKDAGVKESIYNSSVVTVILL